ncbi:MAG: hypothetical protein HYU88_13315 [Chloroflexi bacterium]|nr:hypothetical protein [Chloroflexota bacterium]
MPALAIDPLTPTTLYAGTWGAGMFKSTNGGASWSAVNTGYLNTGYIAALAIDPTMPTTLYAGTRWGEVFKSTDGGASWNPTGLIYTGLPEAYILALATNPTTPTTLYAGTFGAGVFKSTNGGASWSAINTGLTNTYIFALAIDPHTLTTLYAGTNGGGVFQLQQQVPSSLALAVVKAGTGTGSVTSSPAGIACGSDCSESYASWTVVTLTAAPSSGSTFWGWTECPSSAGTTCTVTMDAARTITANFTLGVVLPDLIVTFVWTPASTITPRARLAVTVAVQNPGGPAPASTTRFYLSRHPVRGPGDRLLSPSQRFPALGAGSPPESRTVTVVVPRTLLPGAYFVLACADDLRRVAESDETNNCQAFAATVSVSGPDLVVDDVRPRGSSAAAGGRIAVAARCGTRAAWARGHR